MLLLICQRCEVVDLMAGVVGMCKEHLGVALALKVPVFFLVCRVHSAMLLSVSHACDVVIVPAYPNWSSVCMPSQVTKVDICPRHVLEHTLATLTAILRKPGVRLKPFMVCLRSGIEVCRPIIN